MAQTLAHMNTNPIQTFKASGSITKFRAVILGTYDEEVVAAGDNGANIGVSLETVTDGQNVNVQLAGVAMVECNGAVAKAALVHAAATGGLVDDDVAAGERVLGMALRAATAQYDVIPVLLTPHIYAVT